jgi:hypothetical protein
VNYKSIFLSLFLISLHASNWLEKRIVFNVNNDPIDVFIACHEKDQDILQICVDGAKKYIKNVRRIIVASDRRLTDKAEWFDEADLPFSKKDIAREFAQRDPFFEESIQKKRRVGWYFKQIMNFYAPLVVPGISSNVLILDADTVFLKPVSFVDSKGTMLQAPGTEYHKPYFEHMERFLPGLKRVYLKYSGISHHMLFQRAVLKDLFHLVEKHHQCKFWQAYCRSVAIKDIPSSGSADYEIYFNFVLQRSDQMKIRPLKWTNINQLKLIKQYQKNNFDFVSCHHWLREDNKIII